MGILVLRKEAKWLLPDTFPYHKIYLIAFASGPPSRTQWARSQRSKDLAGFGYYFLAEKRRRG